ncbi:bifunctional hydroxymethylpyrimidine kinase/phosphomethylpyrimidine kinase [Hyphobacterium sp. CCMP332]|uniref:bifunctional hydroxymethylpyrimidine kinase/phosphomethylpyrimidine kinase n=1 Tax=Hyphobacterium sp. CCMP332 TaxID=2749086 RepID=UPI00164F1DFF|nr:bifunctional hydroxymethylpyrimidine kinase/phosphomethylpyrimidine kinase [Hyphobacterium sp. CCMP332]QNL19744.1 bifunctional hydroxymethylpyrimidine kinase/phosphomethylpyrimidine kinase [Hyphobacterium sp. CCMP332]
MTRVLILSSHVAASRVGGRVAVSAMEARGIDTVFCPTVLLGRHPGHGAPGGGAVPPEQFGSMLEGVAAQGLFAQFDAVLTGYFASAEQVEIAAAAIGEIRKASPHPLIVVDPIIGDHGALYVAEDVAIAIRDQLLPLANIITPNAFELGWLSGREITSPDDFIAAAGAVSPVTFMTSARFGDRFGTAYHSGGHAVLAAHAELDGLPNGTGDFLTAEWLAELLTGAEPGTAFETAARNTLDVALKAREGQMSDLPDIHARQLPLHPDAGIDLQPLND